MKLHPYNRAVLIGAGQLTLIVVVMAVCGFAAMAVCVMVGHEAGRAMGFW